MTYECTCHQSAPCPFCESLTEEEVEVFWRTKSSRAVIEFREKKEAEAERKDGD